MGIAGQAAYLIPQYVSYKSCFLVENKNSQKKYLFKHGIMELHIYSQKVIFILVRNNQNQSPSHFFLSCLSKRKK